MFSKMFCTKSNNKPIEKPIEKEIRQQKKLWIHTQKPAPPHKFAPSHRCIRCMSVMHTTLKCPH
jgi:hypothetical protein